MEEGGMAALSGEAFRKSIELYVRACKILVGGVNSPVRAFQAVGINPLLIAKAHGPYIIDVDGNTYIDLICSWGANILGHRNKMVVEALADQIDMGLNYGLTSEKEIELAELIAKAFHSIEKVRFVNSGTEATATAIRLARGYTGRKKIVMFEGCYHGHVDYTLTKAGSGLATFSIPKSAGIPEETTAHTITLPYNDAAAVENVFKKCGDEIAAAIVEPIAGNMGVVKSSSDFLRVLRGVTERHNAVLIFDEVITGFRVTYGGAQHIYGIWPDITCLGKIIGGGLPIGAVGGREDIMNRLAPLGPVYQAGTFSGNPLSTTAGVATLKQLSPAVYERLEENARTLEEKATAILREHGFNVVAERAGSMMTFFFTNLKDVKNYSDVQTCDRGLFARSFTRLLHNHILLPPSQFESLFLTATHDKEVINEVLRAVEDVSRELVKHGS
jgi:glutamate-1-semialdehyde 2,1-aminomutase